MRHFILGAFSFLLAFPAMAGCVGDDLLAQLTIAERAELDQQVAVHPYATGNIWRAEKPDSTVHIIGTYHLFDPRIDTIIEASHDLLENADRAFFEVLDEDEEKMQTRLAQDLDLGFITEGPTLRELLSDEDWSALTARMNEYDLPGFFVAKMQPWFIGMMMAVPPCAIKNMNMDNGLDPVLRQIAGAAGTPMQALDDVDELLELLSQGTVEEQLADLKTGMSMSIDFESQHITILELYLEGKHREVIEFGKLWALKNNPDQAEFIIDAFDSLLSELLDGRNLKWMDTLLPAIADGGFVIAVGAGHLSGDSGILNQLERAGYVLTPVVY